mmetsp:Transcript_10957/g.16309  ORF Transcript_10957/g.16309 Transcript_10957/m.16309 type:complete len:103 (-) Transcript_10957:57-365(-)
MLERINNGPLDLQRSRIKIGSNVQFGRCAVIQRELKTVSHVYNTTSRLMCLVHLISQANVDLEVIFLGVAYHGCGIFPTVDLTFAPVWQRHPLPSLKTENLS